jgi:hypothetical protein
MTFVAAFALGISLLVAAPFVAHRLRRRQAEEIPFAALRYVSPTPPRARKRSHLEDRALFSLRALSILVLALLGASPLVQCSRLALSRGGASVAVAIVLDDSMSMRARPPNGESRFERAKRGAHQVLASLQQGDAVALVNAGAPARIALAPTTDLVSAREALDASLEADRATDLDGAIAMARSLIHGLPQLDKRVVLLSDLADGQPDGPPLGESASSGIPVWVAMPELADKAVSDCAVLSADRAAGRVHVRFACTSSQASKGRGVQLKQGDTVLASAPLPESSQGEVLLSVTGDDARELSAVLTGADAIASDDRALVLVESTPAAIAFIGDARDEGALPGGASVIEHALRALHLEMALRPMPQPPERIEDLAAFAAVILDDAPGFTPEQRRALAAFVDRGGVLLLSLGRRAGAAPLGSTFEPFLRRGPTFGASPVKGKKPGALGRLFGEAAESFAEMDPKGRATLSPEDVEAYESILVWQDDAPLVIRSARGRGEVWITTLPFSTDVSDFPLRPGFLSLVDAVAAAAKARTLPTRTEVGTAWSFPGSIKLFAEGPQGRLPASKRDGALFLAPSHIGAYRINVDDAKELRIASVPAREVNFQPRAFVERASRSAQGGSVGTVDVSWVVALVLLGLVAAELLLRAFTGQRSPRIAS